jgi:FkbM family methyltransferase
MLAIYIRDFAVKLFALTARLGLRRLPFFNRAFLASYLVYKQYFEAGPIERLSDFVPAGSLVIDVGANVGFFSLRFAGWVGERGKVIAIEPEDANYVGLVKAIERGGFSSRVDTLKAVAAATGGEMLLEINPIHPADHKISRDGTGLPVSALTLDQLVQANSGLRLALVKIDVQGAEMMVLKGAGRILKEAGPALFVELSEEGLNKFGSSVTEILKYLAELDYEAFWLMPQGPHARASAADIQARVGPKGYTDVLFLKRLPDQARSLLSLSSRPASDSSGSTATEGPETSAF